MNSLTVKNDLEEILLNYSTESSVEIQYKQKMLNFLRSNENPIYLTNTAGHFTASAWVVSHDGKSVLLTEHAKLGKWFQLGGHIEEQDSSFLNACLREAIEESGIVGLTLDGSFIIDLDIHEIPEYKGIKSHPHFDVTCYIVAPEDAKVTISQESKNLKWVPLTEVKALTDDEAIHRMVDKTYCIECAY